MLPTEIFLSHSSRDRKFASELANVLTQHGLRVFYSPHNIRGAQQWQDEILGGLQRCDWFLVILSPDAIQCNCSRAGVWLIFGPIIGT